MSFKTILVSLSGGGEDRRCLDAAYRVAHDHGGHVATLFVEADPRETMTALSATGFYFSDEYLDELERANQERRLAPQQNFDAWRAAREIASADAMAAPTDATAELIFTTDPGARIDRALAADLVVCPLFPDGGGTPDGAAMIADGLFSAGRPVLAVPDDAALAELGGGRVAVAWNGSREAARALTSSLPLLRRAREILLLHVGPLTQGPALVDVQAFLARHLLDARVVEIPGSPDTGGALLDAVDKANARLLVMGAYSHARAREFVFGGVTRDLLAHARVPLFLSH